jgi:hypothetical protein
VADAFELLDPRSAQAFLKSFAGDVQRKGDACFRRGCVQELASVKPGTNYAVHLNNGEDIEVQLDYDPAKGWSGECSCDKFANCEHIFAAMRALLAEHSAAAVRSLSSGGAAASASLAASRNKPDVAESSELVGSLLAHRKGPLKRDEKKFLAHFRAVHARCLNYGRVSEWDIAELGLPVDGGGWREVDFGPSVPKSELEFWQCIALYAEEHNLGVPEFLQPVTDLKSVRAKKARWQRSQLIERWNRTLEETQLRPPPAPGDAAPHAELRLLIDESGAHLRWRRGGQGDFVAVRHTQLPQIARDFSSGAISFSPETQLLWHYFDPRGSQSGSELHYAWGNTPIILGKILRIPQLEPLVVNTRGEPLARPAEALRWTMTPSEDEAGDYRLRLTLPDGSPLPKILCVLPGRPTLYLTAGAVYAEPNDTAAVLNPSAENSIPAEAIEQAHGISFLQSLGVELPARIRDRVRSVPSKILIRCALRHVFPGSNAEDCLVTVVAEADDGFRRVWDGASWQPEKAAPGRKKRRDPRGEITVYDAAPLARVPVLLEPLNLKSGPYDGSLKVRVTKKFPDLFAAWIRGLPPEVSLELEGDLASFANTDVSGSVKMDVTEADIDWFDLRIVLNVSDTTLTQEEIRLLLKARGGYVRLEGKGWRRLKYDLSAEDDERLARLGLSARELSDEPQRLHALQLADEAARKFLPGEQVEQIKRRVEDIKARVTPDLPAGITAQLRPYQLEGFHFLAYLAANRFGGILADDMGLGKTVQTLAWLLWLRDPAQREEAERAKPAPPSLVVCPKSVMDNWHAEAVRFAPGLRVRLWTATELDGFFTSLDTADLHVLNYSQLRMLGERLGNLRWLAVILDEGQYIKNPNSQTAQIARALKAERRLVLTGTPIENRLLDLWSLMAFAMPGVLGSRTHFSRVYDSKEDPLARRRLSARVRPFLLRRTKEQVAGDLPDRIEEDLLCEIEGEQKALYRAELKRAQQLLLSIKTPKELAEQQFHFLVSLLRLRQICCDPRLLQADSKVAGAKTEALLEQLDPLMEDGRKVLVFSQFVEMLNLLRPVLEERGWPVFYLAGSTENRGDLVRQFQAAEGHAVFLISLKAGGFGLNLTAASYVVLFDPWWNPAVENQAIDRTHRIGQVNKVIAYRLLIKDSIEEKIRALQKQKKALAEDVLGEERFAQSLTLADFQFLFSD